MKAVIQRVLSASVTINGATHATIGCGILVLLGIGIDDEVNDVEWLAQKIVNLRIFDDAQGVMNLNVLETNGEILLVSQFTLHAATKKGSRPSYIKAAKPTTAIPLYEAMAARLQILLNKGIKTGVFGADMQIALVNNGPVTIVIDTKEKV